MFLSKLRTRKIPKIQTMHEHRSIHIKINTHPNINTNRMPRISIYDCTIEELSDALTILYPEIVIETFITVEDLSSIAKLTNCIIATFDQVVNNMDTFILCRGMFRYIEIAAPNKSDHDINMLYKKLKMP